MQLLKTFVGQNSLSVVSIVRHSLLSILESIKAIFLLYPINLIILVLVILVPLYKSLSVFRRKPKFSETYQPLQHKEDCGQQAKIIKKQLRQLQTQLINSLKASNNHQKIVSTPQDKQVRQIEQQGRQLLKQTQKIILEEESRSKLDISVEKALKKSVEQVMECLDKLGPNH